MSRRALMLLTLVVLSACHRSSPPESDHTSADTAAPVADVASGQVVLQPEEIARLGVVTTAAVATMYTPEAAGYGVVLGHDAIALAVAEVATAEAAVRQSRAAVVRVQGLANTPGAFSAETQETTTRQLAADEAALTLAQRKLSATFGQRQPWREKNSQQLLDEVANGTTKLLRATFSPGTLGNALPHRLRILRPGSSGNEGSWTTNTIWSAPADITLPGRSVFALLKDSEVGEGEHLDVWAALGPDDTGVLVPQSAVVVSDDNYWCFVEKPHGRFTRIAVDTSKPTSGGYFVKDQIAVGDAIVTAAAGLLLARASNASTEAD